MRRCGTRLRGYRVPAALGCLALVCLVQLLPSAGARTAAVVESTITREGDTIVFRPSVLPAMDGDTLRICNRANVVTQLFSPSRYNKLGGGKAGSGVRLLRGACMSIPLSNPTDELVKVAIFSEIQARLKLTVIVAPCTARSTSAVSSPAARCAKKKPAVPEGTFVLVPGGTKVTNTNQRELTIDAAGGTARLDHCCDGGAWKTDYAWKVPPTLTVDKTTSISMSIKVYDVEPKQPLGVQMGALAPGFRQDLPAHYPDMPSASKTYTTPKMSIHPQSNEVFVYIGFENGEVRYLYRRGG